MYPLNFKEQKMKILSNTLTKTQAESRNRELTRTRKPVIYLKKIDKQMIFRAGKKNDNRMTRVRYLEDDRPMSQTHKVTGVTSLKRNEIITYAENRELFVLAKSGGVSLFDAMSPKITLSKNDRWYYIPKEAKIPDGIAIAKDIHPDENGHYHYAFQPAYNMKMSDFISKLAEIGKQVKVV